MRDFVERWRRDRGASATAYPLPVPQAASAMLQALMPPPPPKAPPLCVQIAREEERRAAEPQPEAVEPQAQPEAVAPQPVAAAEPQPEAVEPLPGRDGAPAFCRHGTISFLDANKNRVYVDVDLRPLHEREADMPATPAPAAVHTEPELASASEPGQASASTSAAVVPATELAQLEESTPQEAPAQAAADPKPED